MFRTFRGTSLHKVDRKGRVSVPASFRRVLEVRDPGWNAGEEPRLVIVFGSSTRLFLECYTIEAIMEVEERIARHPRGSTARRLLERLFHSQSLEATVDLTGRLVLPAALRKKIGIDSEAQFVAKLDTFQIWNPRTYQDEDSRLESSLREWLEARGEDTHSGTAGPNDDSSIVSLLDNPVGGGDTGLGSFREAGRTDRHVSAAGPQGTSDSVSATEAPTVSPEPESK